MSEVFGPALRQLVSDGEVWDAGTPGSVYRGRMNSARIWSPGATSTTITGKLGRAFWFPTLSPASSTGLSIVREASLWESSKLFFAFWVWLDANIWWSTFNDVLRWIVLSGDGAGETSLRLRGPSAALPSRVELRVTTVGGVRFLQSSNQMVTSGWHHVAAQWDLSGAVSVWLDGVKSSSSFPATSLDLSAWSSVVQMPRVATSHANVGIEQLIVIPGRTVTDAEILEIYNNGIGRTFGVQRSVPDDFLSTMIG